MRIGAVPALPEACSAVNCPASWVCDEPYLASSLLLYCKENVKLEPGKLRQL